MAKGVIKIIVVDRGYGFIQPQEGGEKVFFHATKVREDRFSQLRVGLGVEYEVTIGPRGPQATSVRIVGEVPTQAVTSAYRFLNPYNFVRFLIPPEHSTPAVSPTETVMSAAFRSAGAPTRSTPPESSSPERQLLLRCTPPPHDRYVGVSGRIYCTLEAVTPLFVSNSEGVKTHGKHKSYEFFKLNGEYALPASSLRGMVRSVFEAVTNSCIGVLTDARLSYHLPPAEALKLIPARVEEDKHGKLVRKLQLRLLTGTTALNINGRPQGPQYAAWVPRYLQPVLHSSSNVRSDTPYSKRQNISLNSLKHGKECWALLERIQHPRRKFEFWSVKQLANTAGGLAQPESSNERQFEGYLCITNQNIENKHDERFFFHQNGLVNARVFPLNEIVIKDYRDLIEDYQQRHREGVRKRKEEGKNPEREVEGKPAYSRFVVHEEAKNLEDGDLVYAKLKSPTEVDFIVPVSVPRAAYDQRITRLLPDHDLATCDHYDQLCPACRVFGWVKQLDKDGGKTEKEKEGRKTEKEKDVRERVAYGGRVQFVHGRLTNNAGILEPTPLAILSSPKPTTTRFYLQPKKGAIPQPWKGDDAEFGYQSRYNNVLRGRKFYRHHGKAVEEEYRRKDDRCDDQNRTVRDALLPGSRFEFTVYFENLAPLELGALLWSLEMDEKCFHRLGFAKPLGFGSVTIRVNKVNVLDPKARYSSLTENAWKTLNDWQQKCIDLFKKTLVNYYGTYRDIFDSLPNVVDLRVLLSERTDDLPIHYPRTARIPDPEGKNYEWFMGNNRYVGYTLDNADEDKGLPLIQRDGYKAR